MGREVWGKILQGIEREVDGGSRWVNQGKPCLVSSSDSKERDSLYGPEKMMSDNNMLEPQEEG